MSEQKSAKIIELLEELRAVETEILAEVDALVDILRAEAAA